MTDQNPQSARRLTFIIGAAAVLMAAVVFGVTALLVNIFERQREAQHPFFRVVALDDDTVDPAIWGKNFPQQYDQYKRTVDMARTRHGGSEAIPREPTTDDPRTEVAQSRLKEDPRLIRMWKGYPFSVDYREARGHAYMLEDQTFTQRHAAAPQPGACVNCHASAYTAYKVLGEGDIMAGFAKLNQMPWAEASTHVEHPVTCLDCHDSQTMELRITRPAFIEGIQAYKASKGIENYDVHADATRQQMRSFVCAQCHVEYYFQRGDNRLTFPWHKGLEAEAILAYKDEIDFHDWIHADTGARMLKAQHPEFELWSQGIHAQAGVSCSDCHMPYKRVGAMKISDHHVRSPLLNINNACQVCHNVPEEELLFRAENIQSKFLGQRDLAMDALMDLIDAIVDAQEKGLDERRIRIAQEYHRRGSWFIDFVDAENSSGFHAPQEAGRLLFKALDNLRRGLQALHAPQEPEEPGPALEQFDAPDPMEVAAIEDPVRVSRVARE